jgi:hypothetical protein
VLAAVAAVFLAVARYAIAHRPTTVAYKTIPSPARR